jgi:hypothetical protein
VNKTLALRTAFNFALAAVFRFAHVIFKATHARLFCSNVLVADGTIHTAWRKHNIFNFIRHFHVGLSLTQILI